MFHGNATHSTSLAEAEPVKLDGDCVEVFNKTVENCANAITSQRKWAGAYMKKDEKTVKAELGSDQKKAQEMVCKEVQAMFDCSWMNRPDCSQVDKFWDVYCDTEMKEFVSVPAGAMKMAGLELKGDCDLCKKAVGAKTAAMGAAHSRLSTSMLAFLSVASALLLMQA